MTYCVGVKLKKGLIFMSDTLTNAGVDNLSHHKKMFNWNDVVVFRSQPRS